MTPRSKFSEVTRPSSHFVGRSVFYRPAFCAILQIVLLNSKSLRYRSEISGLISDVNMDNPAKFYEVNMTRSCISKNRLFRDFGL